MGPIEWVLTVYSRKSLFLNWLACHVFKPSEVKIILKFQDSNSDGVLKVFSERMAHCRVS